MKNILFLVLLLALSVSASELWDIGLRSFDVEHLRRDAAFTQENLPRWKRWEVILKADYPKQAVKPLPGGMRLAAELVGAEYGAAANQQAQLVALAKDGFTGVVAVYTGGDPLELLAAIDRVRRAGMKHILLAWSPLPETAKATIFPDPDQLAAALTLLAPHCNGFIVGWRRTSLHFMRREAGYTAYLIEAVRRGNPEIAIVGELYGAPCETARRVHLVEPQRNIPECASAATAMGYGIFPASVRDTLKNHLKITIPLLHFRDDIVLQPAPITGALTKGE